MLLRVKMYNNGCEYYEHQSSGANCFTSTSSSSYRNSNYIPQYRASYPSIGPFAMMSREELIEELVSFDGIIKWDSLKVVFVQLFYWIA